MHTLIRHLQALLCMYGATLKFIDVAPDSFEYGLRGFGGCYYRKAKVIVPVDIAGVPCDYGLGF